MCNYCKAFSLNIKLKVSHNLKRVFVQESLSMSMSLSVRVWCALSWQFFAK